MKMLRVVLIFSFIFFSAKFSFAVDAYWTGANNTQSWSDGWNWSYDIGFPIAPSGGEDVFLTQSNGNYNVNYDTNNLSLNSLLVNGGINLNLPNNLAVVNSEIIGSYKVSDEPSQAFLNDSFLNHSSGANIVSYDVNLGQGEDTQGFYALSGGIITSTLSAGRNLNIGIAGYGQFDQDGGSINVEEGLILGVSLTGEGKFWMNSGVVEAQRLHSGVSGIGTFRQFSGTVDVTDNVSLGLNSGSHGVYALGNSSGSGTPVLTVKNINVGGEGFGEFIMNRGSLTIGNTTEGWLGIDSSSEDGESTFFLNGGTINKLNGEIKIGSNHKGYFVQTGGDFEYAGAMYLGDQVFGYEEGGNLGTPSEGSYTMFRGTLTGGGLTLGEWGGVGRFTQSGGIVAVTDFDLGRQNPAAGPGQGYYYMDPGSDSERDPELYVVNSNIGTRGIGVFEQNAGWHEAADNMMLARDAGSSGTYYLKGGELSVSSTLTVKQSLSQSGAGTFDMTRGVLTAGTIINNDLFNVHDGGSLTEPLLISGDIENNDEFRVTNAVVNFEGTFTNNARFISDPSVMTFDNLEIASNGIIRAGLDEYHINGSFQNKSTKNLESTEWFTRNAQLIFSPGSHEAMFNSQDLGALEAAYNNNFAWGNVDFGGADFTLLAQGDGSWGALYTGTVGGLNIVDDTIQNVFTGNSNIYYLAQYNSWLGGKTYNFANGSGGKFIPVNVVPEPISSALFLLGAGALAGGIRLRKSRNRVM